MPAVRVSGPYEAVFTLSNASDYFAIVPGPSAVYNRVEKRNFDKVAGRAVCAITITGSLAFGGASIATVSSTRGLSLDGHSLSAAGVGSWPLVKEDKLSTSEFPATISFGDGSSITLAALSRVLVCGTTLAPRLALLAGAMDYKLTPDSKLRLFDRTRGEESSQTPNCTALESAAADSGATSVRTGAAAGGSRTLLIGVIAASAAGAAATGAAIAVSGASAAPTSLSVASPQ